MSTIYFEELYSSQAQYDKDWNSLLKFYKGIDHGLTKRRIQMLRILTAFIINDLKHAVAYGADEKVSPLEFIYYLRHTIQREEDMPSEVKCSMIHCFVCLVLTFDVSIEVQVIALCYEIYD
ncbi:hypothetical protein WICPIJ_009544 [Wickerhamomyces pijperi]|uniref:Uncharacterized protein n=1 Tax=Wickerhamomyces pijperi TaxID=599730 RepID=A0A9P8TDP8_WICPI|nr:hypothetical protein WICPIJ_009544 [Wickerhamomyces pijperi]